MIYAKLQKSINPINSISVPNPIKPHLHSQHPLFLITSIHLFYFIQFHLAIGCEEKKIMLKKDQLKGNKIIIVR